MTARRRFIAQGAALAATFAPSVSAAGSHLIRLSTMRAFVECAVIVPCEEGPRDVSIMMAIYTSARTGTPVDLT